MKELLIKIPALDREQAIRVQKALNVRAQLGYCYTLCKANTVHSFSK